MNSLTLTYTKPIPVNHRLLFWSGSTKSWSRISFVDLHWNISCLIQRPASPENFWCNFLELEGIAPPIPSGYARDYGRPKNVANTGHNVATTCTSAANHRGFGRYGLPYKQSGPLKITIKPHTGGWFSKKKAATEAKPRFRHILEYSCLPSKKILESFCSSVGIFPRNILVVHHMAM